MAFSSVVGVLFFLCVIDSFNTQFLNSTLSHGSLDMNYASLNVLSVFYLPYTTGHMLLEKRGTDSMPWKSGFLRDYKISPRAADGRYVPKSSAEETQSGLAW